jgi:hypothetical protein
MIAVLLSVFSLLSCEDEVSNKMSSDYPQNGTVTYGLRQVLQYDPMNINGIDISKKMDFFSTVRFTLYYENGKLAKLKYVNGDVPFSPFQFDAVSTVEGECELNYDVLPNELRMKGTDKVIAYYQDGEFIMPFQLDCASLRYKYTFVNIEQ